MTSEHPFLEPLPPEVEVKLQRVTPPEESVLIQVATDLTGHQSFGEQWLVVTDRRLFIIPVDGVDGTVEMPIEEVKNVKTEALIGGWRLELERKQGAPTHVYYSNSMAPKFAEVAEGIRQLSKGETPTLPTEVERTRCLTCGRLLPEKNGICPACIKKRDTLRRIAGYLKPYWNKTLLLVLVTVAGTVINLLPPLLTQHVIDDVLTPRANVTLLIWLVLGLLGVRVLKWCSEVGRGWLSVWLGGRTITDIRAQVYRHMQYMPLRFYDKRKVGSLISRITNDTDRLEGLLMFGLPYIFNNGLMLVGILGLL
ncbi:MAG: hypothetical protein HY709_10305, partial [Candidatus Latescibacteria bacterium]|nr:hypothetical protein [Candidatus Latescibacterota bacterium]